VRDFLLLDTSFFFAAFPSRSSSNTGNQAIRLMDQSHNKTKTQTKAAQQVRL
jgi:hypothetical protein